MYRCEGAGAKFVANVVKSPEAITRRTRSRESEHETYLGPGFRLVCSWVGLSRLTIIFETVSLRLGLKRAERDLASVGQDATLPGADLNSVDLQRS